MTNSLTRAKCSESIIWILEVVLKRRQRQLPGQKVKNCWRSFLSIRGGFIEVRTLSQGMRHGKYGRQDSMWGEAREAGNGETRLNEER